MPCWHVGAIGQSWCQACKVAGGADSSSCKSRPLWCVMAPPADCRWPQHVHGSFSITTQRNSTSHEVGVAHALPLCYSGCFSRGVAAWAGRLGVNQARLAYYAHHRALGCTKHSARCRAPCAQLQSVVTRNGENRWCVRYTEALPHLRVLTCRDACINVKRALLLAFTLTPRVSSMPARNPLPAQWAL
jgi:hypothetical protein